MVRSYLPAVHKARLLAGMLCAPSASSTAAPPRLLLASFSMTPGSGRCPALLCHVS